jgi:hypothetical protein
MDNLPGARYLAACAIKQRLNADTSDHEGPSLNCDCRQAARYSGRRSKVFQSIPGELKTGWCLLSLPALQRRILSARPSPGNGPNLFFSCHHPHDWHSRFDGQLPVRQPVVVADIGIDASRQQPDGSAKTRDVKVCAVRSAEARNSEGLPMRATRVPSLIRRLSGAPLLRTPPNIDPLSPNVCYAKRPTAPPGSAEDGRCGRRSALDLEYDSGPVTWRDPDRRPLSRQANTASNRSVHLWVNR